MSTTLSLSTGKILARIEDGIGWLTLNNPERRNAIALEMWRGMAEAMADFEANEQVRVVVLSGAGGQAYASGADISEFEKFRANAEQKRQYEATAAAGKRAIAESGKPLLSMITGFCMGGGLALALNTDLRFATPESRFGIPAAKLGVGYEYAGIAQLARLVGPSNAKDIMFSARTLDADEALRIGLINAVHDGAKIEEEVRRYALRLAGNAPLTIRAAKAAVRVFERSPDDAEAVAGVGRLVDACFDSADFKEGRSAFMEKRPARWQGS
jgi:enoyl-CoA hydratase/carnithine racemase